MPNEMRDVTPARDATPPKVITGGSVEPAASEATAKPKRAAKTEPVATVETAATPAGVQPVEEAAAVTIPPRATMIADLRTAYRAAGIKTGPEAEEIARKAGYLAQGKGIAELNEADLFRIHQDRHTIFVAFPEAPTEGGTEA